ncbi:MAG: hypothetical protein ACJARS_002502, partial [bacterium]
MSCHNSPHLPESRQLQRGVVRDEVHIGGFPDRLPSGLAGPMRILIVLAALLPRCANGLRPIDFDTGGGTHITADTDGSLGIDIGTDDDVDVDSDSDTMLGGGNEGECQLPVACYHDNDGCFDFGDFRSADASGTWG